MIKINSEFDSRFAFDAYITRREKPNLVFYDCPCGHEGLVERKSVDKGGRVQRKILCPAISKIND